METTTVKKVIVTPSQAETWLLKNTNNRPLNERLVQEYVFQMKSNKWRLGTDAIGFDNRGRLINGQHRLTAIARSGKAQEMLVANNMLPEAFNIIDIGKVRSAGDLLSVNDIADSNSKAAISRKIMAFKRGFISNSSNTKKTDGGFTNEEVLAFALKNDDKLSEANSIAHKVNRQFKSIEARNIGMLFYVLSDIDKDSALAFFEMYASGAGLTKDHPIYLLRQKLINDMGSNRKMQHHEKMTYMVTAWNHFRKNKKVSRLRYDGPGSDFPKPI